MAGINSGILKDALPLSQTQINELERKVLLEQNAAYAYLNEKNEICFMQKFSPDGLKGLAWSNDYEITSDENGCKKKVYVRTGLKTWDLVATYTKTSPEDTWEEVSDDETLAPGLYQTGAIALYKEQGVEAIEGMMVTSWDQLLADGVIHVEDGLLYTDYNWDDWANDASDTLAGDLILPKDGIIILGEFNGSDWEGRPAFLECYNLTGIMLSSSITNISDCAFNSCEALTNVSFYEDSQLVYIGEYAFQYCENLSTAEIPHGTLSIGNSAFAACGLTSVVIPASVSVIGEYAFNYNESLEQVIVEEDSMLTSLSEHAFEECTALKRAELANCKISTLSKKVFYFAKFESIGPVGSGASLEIPDSVTSIGHSAFSTCRALKSVVIPDGVTSIGSYAFSSSSALTSLTLPNTLTDIENYAFSNCSQLTDIIFNGTVDQWNFSTTNYWNKNVPATHVHCTDGDVAL